MTKALIAAALTFVGTGILIAVAMKFYKNAFESSSDGKNHGLTGLDKLRKIYASAVSAAKHKTGKGKLWTVVYISIYKSKLKSMVEHSNVLAVCELARKCVADAVKDGIFEAGAMIDGNNFVLLTHADGAMLKSFCEDFMVFSDAKKGRDIQGQASLLDIHIGAYEQVSEGVSFDAAVDNARRAAKYALEIHERFCESNYDIQRQISEMELIEKDVDALIDQNAFYTVIQPFIGRDGAVIGGELLSRFRPMEGRDIPIYKYLRAIRKEELFSKFDFAVFDKCLSWQESSGADNLGLISCNFTRYTLASPDFQERVREIMKVHSVVPGCIGIEITEDEGEIDRAMLIENVKALKEMGFLIFLDDFGSGSASIDDLYSIPVDVLKLDKSLLDHTDTESGIIIFIGMCATARRLGLNVLCEGIESAEQEAISDKAGCVIRQGFYYYRPMLISEYEELRGSR